MIEKRYHRTKDSYTISRFLFYIIYFLFFVIICNPFLYSQSDLGYVGARSKAMGKTGLTVNDAWSVFNNPAAMSDSDKASLGIFYENRFLLRETGFGAIAFATPLLNGNLGVGVTHFGFELFQRNRVSVGYSLKLSRFLSMGINVNYFSVRQSDFYSNFNVVNFELGVLTRINEKFSIAARIFNPLNFSYFENDDLKMPVSIELGFSYLFSKSLLLAIETGKAINEKIPVFKSGIEYNINQYFDFRIGLSLVPLEYTFGIGYKIHGFGFDMAFIYHQILGITPNISINYEF